MLSLVVFILVQSFACASVVTYWDLWRSFGSFEIDMRVVGGLVPVRLCLARPCHGSVQLGAWEGDLCILAHHIFD